MFKGITSLTEVNQCDDNTNVPWNKLEKTFKLGKLNSFAEQCAATTSCDVVALKTLLKDKLNRKCLQRGRDVDYDKASGKILNIPSLTFQGDQFVFKHADNMSPLSLLPKNKTVKLKQQYE
jgi:hypothetical protein